MNLHHLCHKVLFWNSWTNRIKEATSYPRFNWTVAVNMPCVFLYRIVSYWRKPERQSVTVTSWTLSKKRYKSFLLCCGLHLLLARLMGQYCFAGWRLPSSVVVVVVVCNAAGVRMVGAPATGRVGIGRPTLHGWPVRLRPVRATPCFSSFISINN